jgi:hypothetical protein
VVQVAVASYWASFARRSDGTVWSWGNNNSGILGRDGNNRVPGQITGLADVVSIGAGLFHAFAVKSDGTLWTWGLNTYGQLGDGTTTTALYPIQVPQLSGVISAVGGGRFTAAVLQDGSVYAWGDNGYGQLGDGTQTAHRTPQPAVIGNVASLTAGDAHVLARRIDGTVSAWGSNDHGQLGDGTRIARYIPVSVPGLSNIVQLAAPLFSSLALQGDGTVWGFGSNAYGELAQPPSVAYHTTPIQVTAGAVAIAAGVYHGLALVTCTLDLQTTVPATGVMGQSVSFDASLTTYGDCQGSPSFLWTFGDGATSTDEDATHTYAAPGTYAWTLTATLGGLSASRGGNITVTAPVLYASASADKTTGDVPLAVTFTGSGSGGTPPFTYSWAFGDGGTSTSQNPSHTYSTKSDYSATLTVRDSTNQTATATVVIHATAAPPAVTSMAKAASPFRIIVNGGNLQNGVKVFINGTEWTNLKWKSTSQIQIKSGAALKAVVPKGVPTTFRFLNPDGGEVSLVWQY